MTQRAANRLSFLEVAKNFVESFIMTRIKMPEAKGDKFFVLSSCTDNSRTLKDFVFLNDIAHIIYNLRSIEAS